MKRVLIFLLTFSLALAALSACAEDAAYVPGEISSRLLRRAFERNSHISCDLSGIFMPGEDLASDPDDAALLSDLSEFLTASALRLGFARTGEGLRFELGGYCLGDEDTVYTDNAVIVSREGLILESDMLGDRRVSVLWESVLDYLGIEGEDAQALLSLRDRDFSDFRRAFFSEELRGALLEVWEKAAPYAAIAFEWASELPVETVSSVEGNDLVPVMNGMKQITIRRRDLLNLTDAVLDRMQQSQFLSAADAAFPTLGELREAIEALQAEKGDGGCMTITYGRGDPLPLILAADLTAEDGDALGDFTFVLAPAEGENRCSLTLRLSATTEEDAFSFSADASVTYDPADPFGTGFELIASADHNGEELFTTEAQQTVSAFTAESGQPGRRREQTVRTMMQLSSDEEADDRVASMSSDSTADWVRTEEGGESYTLHTTSDSSANGESTSVISDTSFIIEPADGGIFDATYYETLAMPEAKIDSVGFVALLTAEEYIPYSQSLELIHWEDLSGEERDWLKQEFIGSARALRDELLSVMPGGLRAIAPLFIGGSVPDDEEDAPSQEGYLEGFTEGYGTGYDDGFRAGYEAATGKPYPGDVEKPASSDEPFHSDDSEVEDWMKGGLLTDDWDPGDMPD